MAAEAAHFAAQDEMSEAYLAEAKKLSALRMNIKAVADTLESNRAEADSTKISWAIEKLREVADVK
jgi:hypothetical protein